MFHVPKRMLIFNSKLSECRAVALFMYYNSYNLCMYICVIYLLCFNYNSSDLIVTKVLQMSDPPNQYFPICKLLSVHNAKRQLKFQTNFLPSKNRFVLIQLSWEGVEKASSIFPCQAKDKNLARLTKTKLHCPRGQGLEFKASN